MSQACLAGQPCRRNFIPAIIFCLPLLFTACGNNEPEVAPLSKVSEMDGREMVLVPAGEFVMGTDMIDTGDTQRQIGTVKPLYLDQHPERKVHLDAFYIDRYEVTNRDYKIFVDATQHNDFPMNWEGDGYPESLAEHPVTNVVWSEALTYCLWAGKELPTELQWEKAARGTDGRLYPWGNDYAKGKANMDIEGARASAPVGSYPEDISVYGAYDLAGNVMEWTSSWYLPYPGNEHTDPRFGNSLKVLRGNGFQKAGHYFLDAYRYIFTRTEADPDAYFENVGFRCSSSRGFSARAVVEKTVPKKD